MKGRTLLRLYITRLKERQKSIVFWSVSTVFAGAIFILAVLVAYQASAYYDRWNKVQDSGAYDFVLRNADEETVEYVQSRRDTTMAWLVGEQETWEKKDGTPITVRQLDAPFFFESDFYLHKGKWPSKVNEMALDFQFALETMPELLFGDKIHFVHDGVEKAYTVTGLYSGYGDGTEVLALGEVSIGDLYVATSSEDVKQTQDVIAEQTGLRPKVNYNHMETDWLPYYEQNPTLKSTIYVLIVALFLFTVTCTYALARQIKLALQNDYLTLLRLGLSPRKYKRDMTVLGTILAVGITGLSTGVGFLFYHFVGVDAVLSIDTLRQSSYYFEIGTIHLLFPSTMLMFVALSLFVVFMFILTVALSSRKKVRKERSHIKPAVVVVLSTVFLLLVQVIDSANGYLKEANGSHEVEEDFVYIQFLREDQEDLIMGELREKTESFLELHNAGYYHVQPLSSESNEDEQYRYWDSLAVMEVSEEDLDTLWEVVSPNAVNNNKLSSGGMLLANISGEDLIEGEWGAQKLELGSQFQLAPLEEETTFSDQIFEVEAVAEFQGSYASQMIIIPENTFGAVEDEWSEIVLFSLDRDAGGLKAELYPLISKYPYVFAYIPSQYGFELYDEQKQKESKLVFVAFILSPFLLVASFIQFSIGFANAGQPMRYRSLLIFGTAVIASVTGWLATIAMEGGPVTLTFLFGLFTCLSLAGFIGLATSKFKRKKNE